MRAKKPTTTKSTYVLTYTIHITSNTVEDVKRFARHVSHHIKESGAGSSVNAKISECVIRKTEPNLVKIPRGLKNLATQYGITQKKYQELVPDLSDAECKILIDKFNSLYPALSKFK